MHAIFLNDGAGPEYAIFAQGVQPLLEERGVRTWFGAQGRPSFSELQVADAVFTFHPGRPAAWSWVRSKYIPLVLGHTPLPPAQKHFQELYLVRPGAPLSDITAYIDRIPAAASCIGIVNSDAHAVELSDYKKAKKARNVHLLGNRTWRQIEELIEGSEKLASLVLSDYLCRLAKAHRCVPVGLDGSPQQAPGPLATWSSIAEDIVKKLTIRVI